MKKGMTLIELLVASAIALLLMGVVASTLIMSLKYWRLIDVKAEAQLNAMLAIDQIRTEISSSNINSVAVNAGFPKALSFQSANYNNKFYTDAQGAPSWMTYVIYYVAENSTNLVRREIYSPGPVSALPAPTLISYCNGTGALKAVDISEFSPSVSVPGNYVNIYIKTRVDHPRENSTNLTARIYPRN